MMCPMLLALYVCYFVQALVQPRVTMIDLPMAGSFFAFKSQPNTTFSKRSTLNHSIYLAYILFPPLQV